MLNYQAMYKFSPKGVHAEALEVESPSVSFSLWTIGA
jgi:hypothetical protein